MKFKLSYLVFFVSLFISVALTIACWDMNFWPTDAEVYYMPAAKELPSLKYLSQIHNSLDEERIKWLHGKEYHVLAISLFQRAMSDTETLRPLLLLGIVCIFFSSILIFAIARQMWGEAAGLAAWFLFSTSFWPYVYILFAKHQTQGLLFFLLSLFFMLRGRPVFYAAAGMAMGVSIFSSTVSVLYLPFIAALFLYTKKDILKSGFLFAAGFAAALTYATWPDVAGNLKSYWEYIRISGQYNHFFYNQRVLAQWLPFTDLYKTRGGWLWIIKYFFLVMPVAFPLYIAAAAYMVRRHWQNILLVLLSFAPAIMAEIKGVAQYGANYFPAFFGVAMFLAYTLSVVMKQAEWPRIKKYILALAAAQVLWNGYIFVTDIYPCRMASTFAASYLKKHSVSMLPTYPDHPLRRNFLDTMPKEFLSKLQVVPIATVVQSPGLMLLPPVNLDNIYRGSNGAYDLYDHDLVLNAIVRQGRLDEFTVAKFKTLANSLVWSQEEEVLAYRYLVQGQFPSQELSYLRFLDGSRIRAAVQELLPSQEDIELQRSGLKRIGVVEKFNIYEGTNIPVETPRMVQAVSARVQNMGLPNDSLRAYVFKIDEQQPTWVALDGFVSDPMAGAGTFHFPKPLALSRGLYSVVIYRTGPASDKNYYIIDPARVSFLDQ